MAFVSSAFEGRIIPLRDERGALFIPDRNYDHHEISRGRRGRSRRIVWEIERKLAEDGARPIIYYGRGATCWQPRVKGLTVMVNSIVNGWRMEDVWLDK